MADHDPSQAWVASLVQTFLNTFKGADNTSSTVQKKLDETVQKQTTSTNANTAAQENATRVINASLQATLKIPNLLSFSKFEFYGKILDKNKINETILNNLNWELSLINTDHG